MFIFFFTNLDLFCIDNALYLSKNTVHYFGVALGDKLSNVLLATRRSFRKAHRGCYNMQVRHIFHISDQDVVTSVRN